MPPPLHQLLVLEAFGGSVFSEAGLAVLFVLGVAAFEEIDARVALECEDMGGDAVEEPAVVADHHGAAGKSVKAVFEGNYAEYEENRKMRLGDAEPRLFKYKKLME